MLRNLAWLCVMFVSAPAFAQIQWPQDSSHRFITHCANFHKDLIAPCRCIIDGIKREISPEDFLKQTNAGTIEHDVRYKRITSECAAHAQQARQ